MDSGKEHENQQTCLRAERTSSLYARMRQEADRIRRWKIQTELDIKQKDSKIEESNKTIESLRKSMLGQQIHNEKLSMKLQEQSDSRQELIQKISSTREMCNILKNHANPVEIRLQNCETQRLELKSLEQEHAQKFQELAKAFEALEVSTQTTIDSLHSKLTTEQLNSEQKKKGYQTQIDEFQKQIASLVTQQNEKDLHIREITEELSENGRQLTDTMAILDNSTARLQQTENENKQQADNLQTALNDLAFVTKEKEVCQEVIAKQSSEIAELALSKSNLEKEFQMWKQSQENTMLALREQINDVNSNLDKEKHLLQNLHARYDKCQIQVVELTDHKDALIMDKSELNDKLTEAIKLKDDSESMIAELQEKLQSSVDKNTKLSSAATLLEDEKAAMKVTVSELHCQIDTLVEKDRFSVTTISELTSDLKYTKEQLVDRQKNADDHILRYQKINTEMDEVLSEKDILQTNCDKLKESLGQMKEEVDALVLQVKQGEVERENLQVLFKSCEQELNICQGENSEAKQTIKELEEKLMNANKNNENLIGEKTVKEHEMQRELAANMSNNKDLETEIKSLKAEVATKQKQIKELEKEVKSLKTKNEKLTKRLDTMKSEVESKTIELTDVIQSVTVLNSKIEVLENQNQEKDDLMRKHINESETLKAKINEVTELKDKTIENFQMEMASTFERCVAENKAIINTKEAELNIIRSQFEAQKSETQKLKTELQEMKGAQTQPVLNILADAPVTSHSTASHKTRKVMKTSPKASVATPPTTPRTPRTPSEGASMIPAAENDKSYNSSDPSIGGLSTLRSNSSTNQKGILRSRTPDSLVKRRKVTFQRQNSFDDSSSSEAMEVEINEDKLTKYGTPLLTWKPSPRGQTKCSPEKENTSEVPLMKPKPRGLPIYKRDSIDLKPPITTQPVGNIRKSPIKPRLQNKIFTYTTEDRRKTKTKKDQAYDWLDFDSVFGFTNED